MRTERHMDVRDLALGARPRVRAYRQARLYVKAPTVQGVMLWNESSLCFENSRGFANHGTTLRQGKIKTFLKEKERTLLYYHLGRYK